jgi:hypothetical protein
VKFCEPCRIVYNLLKPRTFPYHDHEYGRCDLCNKIKDCYDYPAIYTKPKKDWTFEQKTLDKRLQQEYHQKCDEMIIGFRSGSHAGATNQIRTDELRNTLIKLDGETDWYATYKIRLKLQQGYQKQNRR